MKILFSVLAFLILAAPAHAAVPVTGNADQEAMLQSDNPRRAKMKRMAYDTWRHVVEARRMDEADTYIRDDYTSTWFDMFRFEEDRIVEHWDTAHMP